MTKHFGLLGENLNYSLSPMIHNFIYEQLGLDAHYTLFEVSRERLGDADTLNYLRQLSGFNVTIPYKEEIMKYLDAIDPIAQRIGAVNTVICDSYQMKGFNTDYYGFLESLKQCSFTNLARAVILGTGGAAKMAVVALEDFGFSEIIVVSREVEKASEKFPTHDCVTYESFNRGDWPATLLINCTPLGQSVELTNQTIANTGVASQEFIFDLNYNPPITPLLNLGNSVDTKGMNGLTMLLAQAIKAEELWLNQKFDMSQWIALLLENQIA